MRTTLVSTLVAAVAFCAGWLLSPGPCRFVYTTALPVSVTGAHGEQLGQLPTGTRVVSKLRLENDGDVGWWGMVPVSFGTMDEAKPALKYEGRWNRFSYSGPMLNGHPAPRGTQARRPAPMDPAPNVHFPPGLHCLEPSIAKVSELERS